MTLYHLTWKGHVESILRLGLLPNYRPNKWPAGALARSRGKTFLCDGFRRGHWLMIYGDCYAGWPAGEELVWLEVDAGGLALIEDQSSSKEDYAGDYWTAETIPPGRIKVTEKVST